MLSFNQLYFIFYFVSFKFIFIFKIIIENQNECGDGFAFDY